MRVRGARLVALGCLVLLAACGLGTAGLSGDGGGGGSEDAGGNALSDAPSSTEGSSPSGDAGSTGSDASGPADSTIADVADGAMGDAATAFADSSVDVTETGEAAIGGDAGEANDSGGANEAGSANDSGGADTGSGSDSGAACDDAAGCIAVPSGWTLVAFAATQASSCPSGFGQPEDVVEGPDAGSACGCGTCSVTTQPSCASGPIQVSYDVNTGGTGSCNLPALVTPIGNSPAGTCLTDMYQGNYAPYDAKYVPSGPSGGVCATPGAQTASNVTYTAQDRVCTPSSAPPAGCNGTVCAPTTTGPYAACITAPGDVDCPSGPLSAKHLVGTDASFDCSACSCAVTGQCAGTVTLYSDNKCTKHALPVPADGTCISVASLSSSLASSYMAYIYEGGAPTQVACTSSGSSSAENVALTNEATVCCAP